MKKILPKNPVFFITLISLLVCCTAGYGEENFLPPQSDRIPGPENASGNHGAGEEIRVLTGLISMLGIDISYGTEGETVFSMVNSSLIQIVDDIASGNPEGMNENLLIREFFRYLGIDSSSFSVDPEDGTLPLRAVKRFEEINLTTYGHPDITPDPGVQA